MRTLVSLAILAFIVTLGGPIHADEKGQEGAKKKAPEPTTRVWEGYLFKDSEGRVQIGWPVIAMGVMAQPSHIVDVKTPGPFDTLLTPAEDTYVFWNYRLEEDFAKCLPRLPKVLVQVRGRVALSPADGDRHIFDRGPMTMLAPEVVTVELVTDAWLKAWAPVFREPWSPWRIREKPKGDKTEGLKGAAVKLLAAVKAMRKVEGAAAERRAEIKRRFPKTQIVNTFRVSQEHAVIRWLHDMREKHGMKLEGLDALGPVPPTGNQIQRLFLEAKTKAAFLAAVRAKWKGALSHISLPYYVPSGRGGISYATIGLDAVSADWSEKDFTANQKRTRDTLKR